MLFQKQYFREVYDGTGGMAATSELKKTDITHLQRGDIVHLECQVQRYDPNKSGSWNEWRVSFQLVSIIRVFGATSTFPVENESGMEDNDLEQEDASVFAATM